MSSSQRAAFMIAVIQMAALAIVWVAPSPMGVVAGVAVSMLAAVMAGGALVRYEAEAGTLRRQCGQLSDNLGRYREYAESIADWYWESDADHRFTWFSEEFEKGLEVPVHRMLGKRRWDVVSERMEIDSEQWQNHIADLSGLRPFRDFKYWLEDGKGRARWIKVSGLPRFTDDGTFIGYRGTGTDITAAEEAAHRMHMLNRAVEQSPVSIVITNLDAEIQYVNSKFLQVTGYAMDEVIGQNPRILKSDRTDPETYQSMWNALVAGEKWEGELINRRKSGDLYWELATIQPIQNIEGVVSNYLAIKADITEQKRNQERLAELVEELRRSNEELEQFAYVASHDLRQPLRMISAYLGLLHRAFADSLNEDTTAFFGYAIDGAKRLDSMIVDLLEYSRIGRMAAPLEPLDLAEVVAEALRHLEFALADAGAEVTVAPGLPCVDGDPSELVRLFQNLVGNAIKYGLPARPPRLEVSWRDGGTEWVVAVKDNGIGIANDDLQRVFGIFQRLVTRDQVEGTGIGLAICRKIAEHHGGRIWVESELDQGSTFLVTFPKR